MQQLDRYRQKATEQKATGQKATERNVKMLLSCQDVLERLRVVLKTVEQIVLSSVLGLVSLWSIFHLCLWTAQRQQLYV